MSTTLLQPRPGATLPTFTETKGAEPFDWNAFLTAPTRTAVEWRKASILAESWVTCACGNQCSALPRRANNEPDDYKLWDYGTEFSQAILSREVEVARFYLDAIEVRSDELLRAQAQLSGKECNACGGLGCPNCHGGQATKAAAPEPCGGCGASHPNERCLGCRHDFKVLGSWDGKDQHND